MAWYKDLGHESFGESRAHMSRKFVSFLNTGVQSQDNPDY
jgi:hypothetical protein